MPVSPETDSATLLRSQGLRVTAPRRAVLDVLEHGSHLDADSVTQAVRAKIGSVSTQAVYDVLAALTGAGLLRRIEPAGMAALYERRVQDNHHHLVCRACQQIVDVDCVVGHAPCIQPPPPHHPWDDPHPDPAGFTVVEAEVVFWGLCPQCRTDIDAQSDVPVGKATGGRSPAT